MPSELQSHWSLDPSMTFLNHGSFGACPTAVLNRQSELRAELEREPVQFMLSLSERLVPAFQAVASFVGAESADLAFVPNATAGVNTVLRSLPFGAGDEILLTDHGYNACRNAAEWVAARWGASVRVASIPFPLREAGQATKAVLDEVNDRTRLVLLDHVTSPTGIVLPVAEIVAKLTERGIETLIDGAHAPGMVPLDLGELGATYYTGNCHKWMCAPKGAAFLYVQADRQEVIAPLTISHGLNDPDPTRSRFRRLFDWTGTGDPTPFLCIPDALTTMEDLCEQGWPGVREANRAMALAARQVLTEALELEPPTPETMIGSMVSLPIAMSGPAVSHQGYMPLAADLFERGFEVPVFGWPDARSAMMRVSAQLYNSIDDYRRLAEILTELLPDRG